MTAFAHSVERDLLIQATPETVFGFFTDSSRWASCWGAGSTIDPRVGGRVYIRYPGAVEATGEVLEIEAPRRLVFSYGFAKGTPIPAGASRVAIQLEAAGAGTRLRLQHDFAEPLRDELVQGWRFQLSLFANVIANDVHAGVARTVDAWFDAWAKADDGERAAAFAAIADPDVRFSDPYSALAGLADVVAHSGAAQRFMPGIRIRRAGDVRHCQGTALVDWIAGEAGGPSRATGVNVFELGGDGRIRSVIGFWATRP